MNNSVVRQIAVAAAAAGLILFSAQAGASDADLSAMTGTDAGTSVEEVTASLTAQGFEVRKVEAEDGMLEAYVVKDGERYEIYVDPRTGKIAKIEED